MSLEINGPFDNVKFGVQGYKFKNFCSFETELSSQK